MKDLYDILKDLLPIWLVLILLCLVYLIYLYTKIFKKTNDLAEKQAQYLMERIDSVDKTTGIFERTIRNQEYDLNRLYEQIEEYKFKEEKKIDLMQQDKWLMSISRIKRPAGNERFHASGGVCPQTVLCEFASASPTRTFVEPPPA